MRITRFSDYSLRVLIYLGAKDAKASIAEISVAFNISKNHLMKAVHNLVKLGYVGSIRGKAGGIFLSRTAKSIKLGDIIQQLEPDMDMAECFNKESGSCTISPVCRLKGIFWEATESFLKTLNQYTLADLIQNKKDLSRLILQ